MTFRVGIQCMTYNHSKYILDALNGFVMQKTDFPYVIMLVDDASTDGAERIISEYIDEQFNLSNTSVSYTKETEYAKITYAQHKTNLNCYIVLMYLKYNHYQIGRKQEKINYLSEWLDNSKYIALCEGDDYWIDPFKLQKQVDIMDSDCRICLCHSAFYFNEVNASVLFKNSNYQYKEDIINGIIGGNQYRIQPNTVLYRTSDLIEVLQSDLFLFNSSYFLMSDTQLWVALLQKGDIYYIESPTAVYRVLQGSACRSLDIVKKFRFDLSCSELRLYLIEKYAIKYDNKRELVAEYNRNLLRYRLFNFSFKPLFNPTLLSHITFLFLKKTGVYKLLQNKLYNKYSNGNS